MKARAVILVFSFAMFLTETASFPMQMINTCKKTYPVKTSCMQTSCAKTKCGMKPTKCTGKKDACKKPTGKCKDNPACTFCPACTAFTFQPQYELTLKYSFFTKKYALISSANIAAYIPPVWKPPNGYSLFS
jgi:hypothetical protein